MRICEKCEHAKKVNMPHSGNGASAHLGHFGREGHRCNFPNYEKWYEVFYGKTSPRSCPYRKGIKENE